MRTEDPRKQPKNRIKARIGEALVESLLEEAGNTVRRFGQEWRTTAFSELLPDVFKFVDLPEKARMKPDLAIRNRNGRVEGVEVKFMLTDSFLFYLVPDYLKKLAEHWPGTRVVVVNLKFDPLIQVLVPPYLDEKKNFLTVPIHEIPEWGVPKELSDLYEKLIKGLPKEELTNNKGGP